jgi:hypothetical protein
MYADVNANGNKLSLVLLVALPWYLELRLPAS